MFIPGLGILRRLLFALAVPVVLFLIANVVIERLAEGRIAGAFRTTFDLDEEPDVELSGFPIIVNVLRGDLPSLAFEATDVDVEGLELRRVDALLEDIRADDGFLSSRLTIVVGRGDVEGEADEDSLNRFLRRRKERARIELREGETIARVTRTIGGARRKIVARGRISLSRGVLRFRPRSVTVDGEPPSRALEAEAKRRATIAVEIPELPGDIRPTEVQSHAGFLVVAARLRDYRLDLRR